MGFCQGFCNRVFQPPLQLRGVGIYSHGCKQGLFPAMSAGWVWSGSAFRTWRSSGRADGTAAPWWRSTPGASRRAMPPGGWNRGLDQLIPRALGCVDISAQPDESGGEMQKAQVSGVQFLKPGEYPAIVLYLVDEAFDQMALPVQMPVIAGGFLPV